MKKGIHPEYREVAFHDTSADEMLIPIFTSNQPFRAASELGE